MGDQSAYNRYECGWSHGPQKISGWKKWNFGWGTLAPKFGEGVPYLQGRWLGTLQQHLRPKKLRRYLQPLRRKSRSKKNFQRPLAAKPVGGVAPNRASRAGSPRRTFAESFVDLSRRVRPLDDFEEISICPYGKMHVPDIANLCYICAPNRQKH